jgi:hypothetical protein
MQINNKFNIGDKVYFISGNFVSVAKIIVIRIEINDKNEAYICYDTDDHDTHVGEHRLFESKEDLKNSL